MTGYVYFMQSVDGGPIKIGFSANPLNRRASLQTASPTKLRILALIAGTMWDERRLHDELAAHRLRGDWFEDVAEVRAAMPAESRVMGAAA